MAQPYADEFAPTSAERIARNDAVFRSANESIAETAAENDVGGQIPFICECAEPTCREVVRLTIDEYRDVRADPRYFVNAVSHEVAVRGWDEVIAVKAGYVVVE